MMKMVKPVPVNLKFFIIKACFDKLSMNGGELFTLTSRLRSRVNGLPGRRSLGAGGSKGHYKFLLLLLTITIHAQNVSQLFDQASKHYHKNECAQALALYDQISNKGAATWYNMGNCAYKLNDQIKALLYWQRAYKYGTSQIKKDSLENMRLLSIPYTVVSNRYLNVSPWLMQLLFFFIFSIFLIIGYFLIRAKHWIFLLLSISVLVSAGRITYMVSTAPRPALVMQENASLRAGPGIEYHEIHAAKAGTLASLLKRSQGWAQVMIEGMRGWIENNQIEEI